VGSCRLPNFTDGQIFFLVQRIIANVEHWLLPRGFINAKLFGATNNQNFRELKMPQHFLQPVILILLPT
jgi:hypothetical protein